MQKKTVQGCFNLLTEILESSQSDEVETSLKALKSLVVIFTPS